MDDDTFSVNLVPLSQILPSPYQIVYASLLLAISVPVTFAGAFLTLDRTRSFAPLDQISTPTAAKKRKWRLEGGVGGLLGGWLVGVHLSTLIALLIMNCTTVAPLGGIQFLLVWLLSALPLSVLSGRWRIIAVSLIGIGGGAAFSLFVSVVCHPERLARVILIGVFVTISAVLCFLPIPKVQHGAVRSASAWLGALGIILAISILSGVSDWMDVWARLWVSWDSKWGTSQEKGLSAAFMGLAMVGIAVDWLLKRQFGECPDEKWDSYLANYAANLPNGHDRPGTFAPSVPFWKKIFSNQPKDPILFPPDKALLSTRGPLSPPPYQAGKIRSKSKKGRAWDTTQPLNRAGHSLLSDSDNSSSDEEFGGGGKRYIPRPWAPRKDTQATTLSGATLADTASTSSKGKHKGGVEKDLEKGGKIVYSDGEDVTASIRSSSKSRKDRDAPEWTPEFIKRSSLSGKRDDKDDVELEVKSARAAADSPPPGAVPVTPSLLRALDRVSQAHNEAYGGIISQGHTPHASTPGHGGAGASTPGLQPFQMPTPGGGYDWAGFWRTVEDKTEAAVAGPPTQPKPTR